MKNKWALCYFIVIYFIFLFIQKTFATGGIELETTFFDVGQGNCTVLGYRGLKESGHVLLVDAGSSEYDEIRSGRSQKKQQLEIAKKIESFFSENAKKNITIVLTHGDKDHYNWIPSIINNLKDSDIEINFFCGGKDIDYENIKDIFKKRKTFFTSAEKSFPIINFSPGTCEVLAALKTTDKNTNSIVLKVAYANKSVLLTGDATNKTIKSIKGEKLETTILQVSHHGASDDCNSEDFIKSCKPQAVVFSSGIYKNMYHPRESVLKNAAKILPMLQNTEAKFHLVRYYKEEDLPLINQYQISPFGIKNFHPLGAIGLPRKELGYSLAKTSLFLFTTSTNGTISFSFKSEEKSPLDYPEISLNDVTDNTKLQESLKIYSTNLTSLNLSNYKLNDKKIKEFLPVLPKNLISLSLENNILENNSPIKKIIKNHTNLRELNLKGNKIKKEELEKIKNEWNNKGLELEN